MSRRPHAFLFAAAAALAPLQLAAQQAERFSLTGDVAVFNVAGIVRIEPSSSGNVIVEVTPGGHDADALRIERGELQGWQTLRVRYPEERVVYARMSRGSRTSFNIREDGTFGRRWSDSGRESFNLGTLLRFALGEREGGRITVSGSGGGLEAYADLRILVPAGRTVAVHLGAGEVEASNIEGNLVVDTRSGPITARELRGSIRLATGSGNVQLTGAQGDVLIDTGSGAVRVADVAGDRLLVDTGSGSVDVNNARAASVNIDTGSGGVEVSGMQASDVRIDTGSGGIRLRDATADDLLLDTGSGSVNVDLRNKPRRARIDTGSGGVTLSVPADFGASLDLSTGSGGISTDLPVQIVRKTRSALRGTIGDGSAQVVIDTGSGGIRIRSR